MSTKNIHNFTFTPTKTSEENKDRIEEKVIENDQVKVVRIYKNDLLISAKVLNIKAAQEADTNYYESGAIKDICIYANDQKQTYTSFFESGKLNAYVKYGPDNLEVEKYLYDETGALLESMVNGNMK